MEDQDLDLTIIEATDTYSLATKRAPRASARNGDRANGATTALATDTDRDGDPDVPELRARVAHLEAEIDNWQRRTVIWRERALSAQGLNEALNRNLEDLRTAVQALAAPAPPRDDVIHDVGPSRDVAPPVSTTVVEWCNRVFRRDFWTGPANR